VPVPAQEYRDVAALGRGAFGVVVDATGAPAAIEAGFAVLDRGGRLLIFGVASGDAALSLSPFRICNDRDHRARLDGRAEQLRGRGRPDGRGHHRHRPLLGPPFSLAEFPRALASGRAGEGIKIQVAPHD